MAETIDKDLVKNLGIFSQILGHYPQPLLLIQNEWALKKCSEILKEVAMTREITQDTVDRLIALILLISLAYCLSTFNGKSIKYKGVSNYVARPTESGRTYRRHSNFSIGKAWSKLGRFNDREGCFRRDSHIQSRCWSFSKM